MTYLHDRPASAIDEYCRHLTAALCAAGTQARYVDGGLRDVRAHSVRPGWVLLQYNPNSYGRRGFAPGLVHDAIRVRRRWPRTPLVVTVHEAWLAMSDWRGVLMGSYQRAQLQALLALADGVIVTREQLADELGRPCAHVPVASNIAPVATTRQAARERLGTGNRLVVALFGTANPDRLLHYAAAAIKEIAAHRGPEAIQVLNLGRETPAIDVPRGVDVRTPGALDAGELSLALRASDVLLLPLSDGLSTRRGTLMAGLAHGVPVVGLRGVNTGPALLHHAGAMILTPVGDVPAYAHAARALTGDRARLAATGDAGRRLYESAFAWPVVARKVIAALGAARR